MLPLRIQPVELDDAVTQGALWHYISVRSIGHKASRVRRMSSLTLSAAADRYDRPGVEMQFTHRRGIVTLLFQQIGYGQFVTSIETLVPLQGSRGVHRCGRAYGLLTSRRGKGEHKEPAHIGIR